MSEQMNTFITEVDGVRVIHAVELMGIFQSSYIISPASSIGGHDGGIISTPIAVIKFNGGRLARVDINKIGPHPNLLKLLKDGEIVKGWEFGNNNLAHEHIIRIFGGNEIERLK